MDTHSLHLAEPIETGIAKRERRAGPKWQVVLGFILMLAVGYPYSVAALIMPGPAVYIMWGLWTGLFLLQIVERKRPWVVLSIPLIALFIFVATATIGDLLGAWTA